MTHPRSAAQEGRPWCENATRMATEHRSNHFALELRWCCETSLRILNFRSGSRPLHPKPSRNLAKKKLRKRPVKYLRSSDFLTSNRDQQRHPSGKTAEVYLSRKVSYSHINNHAAGPSVGSRNNLAAQQGFRRSLTMVVA
jgi:hypothetical protein